MKENHEVVLSVEDLTVSFDGFKAIDALNLYIHDHRVHVIIGPNGAGKTTFVDLVCGKTKATSGRIKFRDKDIRGQAEYRIVRSGIGRKFQTPSIYENLTVFENLEISYPKGRSVFGSLAFLRSEVVIKKIRDVATEVFLIDHLDAEAGILSHGQKQWLEIGMLIIQEPQLLFLDEPVAGMSPAEREQTAELLKRISKDRAIVIIEHDMEFVEKIADRVTVLHLGKILAEGSMQSIQANEEVQKVYLGH